jgi:hypothetical protein
VLRIRPHQDIKHTLLVSRLSELVTAHGDRHASCVHGWRSTAIEDCYAADALYHCVDFGLDCELVRDAKSFLQCSDLQEKEIKAELPLFVSLLPSGPGPSEELGDRKQ